jgi:HSP20 family molecular chaperone IbpA
LPKGKAAGWLSARPDARRRALEEAFTRNCIEAKGDRMTNASYTAARCWPVARIVATPEEFRATVDLEGSDDTDVDVELVGHTVRLTGRGLDPGTLRFELRFELPPDADRERLRVVEEHGRLLVSAPCCAPRLRKLEIEHAGHVTHDAAPS